MPIYEYSCSACGKTDEIIQKFDALAPETCSNCGGRDTLKKLLSRSAFHLKGGGWYSDLYASPKPNCQTKGCEEKSTSCGANDKKESTSGASE